MNVAIGGETSVTVAAVDNKPLSALTDAVSAPYTRFHGDVIRRVMWASGTTGWQNIFWLAGSACTFAWIHTLFTLILLTHKIMIMFCICVGGYLWHCVDCSF